MEARSRDPQAVDLDCSITVVDAATGRYPLTKIADLPHLNDVFTQFGPVRLAAFDLWSRKRIHRVTVVAALFSIMMSVIAIPVGSTRPWIAFASWMLGRAKAIKG
jgi:hypothetical protein